VKRGWRMLLGIDVILCVEEDAVAALREELPDFEEGDSVIFRSSAGPRSLQLVIAAAAEAKQIKCQHRLTPTFSRIGMRARYAVIVLDRRSIVATASRSMSDSRIFEFWKDAAGAGSQDTQQQDNLNDLNGTEGKVWVVTTVEAPSLLCAVGNISGAPSTSGDGEGTIVLLLDIIDKDALCQEVDVAALQRKLEALELQVCNLSCNVSHAHQFLKATQSSRVRSP